MRIRWAVWAAGLSFIFTAPSAPARADQVILQNGDRLTGKILLIEGGKIVVETELTGTVTADLANVASMSRDQQATTAPAPTTTATVAAPAPVPPITPVPPPASPPKWTGTVKAGAIVTRGNSDTENFNINFDAARRTEKHRITTSAGWFFGRQRNPDTGEESTTTNNWFVLGKYDYFWTPKFYSYVKTRVEQDMVAHLDLRVIPGVGVGYQWFDQPDFKFSTEAGIDWVYERYENDGINEHFAARAAYHLEKRLNERVTFFHNLEYLPSFHEISDFNINADAGIRSTLYKNLFTEFKAEWRFDSTPAPGASDSDFRYTLNIGLTF